MKMKIDLLEQSIFDLEKVMNSAATMLGSGASPCSDFATHALDLIRIQDWVIA